MKYSIDFIKTKLKADSKQFSYDEIVEIENEIKMSIKTLTDSQTHNITDLQDFIHWKTLVCFFIYINKELNDPVKIIELIDKANVYIQGDKIKNQYLLKDNIIYQNIIIEEQIKSIVDIIKILFKNNSNEQNFITKIEEMLSKLKNLNNKEKPVLYKMKDEIKNIYYTLKSDISIVQYIFLLHTVTDFIKWIKIRKDDAERAIKIILKYKEEYKKATQKIHELQLEVIDLNRKKQQLEIENKKLTAQLLFLLDLIHKKEAEIQALQQEIAIKNQIIAQLEIIIQQKETEIHELKIKYQQDMEQKDNEIAGLEKQIPEKQKEIEELKIQYQHEITQKNIEIAVLQQQIIEKQKEIEELKIQYEQEIKQRDNEIATLKTQIIEKEAQIQELIKQHIKDLKDADAEIEKMKLEIKKYSTQINYLNQAKQLLQEHLKLTNCLMNRQTILTLPEDSVYQPVVVDETLPNDITESKTDIVEPVMVHIDPKPNVTLEPILPMDSSRITETVSMIGKEEEKISDEMKDEGIQTVSVIGKEEEKHEMPDEMKDQDI